MMANLLSTPPIMADQEWVALTKIQIALLKYRVVSLQ